MDSSIQRLNKISRNLAIMEWAHIIALAIIVPCLLVMVGVCGVLIYHMMFGF